MSKVSFIVKIPRGVVTKPKEWGWRALRPGGETTELQKWKAQPL